MVNLREKSWLIPLSSGILLLLFAILPIIIHTKPSDNLTRLVWILGALYINDSGVITTGFLEDAQLIALGVICFIIMLTIGIILVLSAILTMRGKNIPHKGLIWLISGIVIVLLPTLYTALFWGFCDIFNLGEEFEELIYGFSTLMLFPISGILAILPGIQELANK